jgi:methylated-DNA-[protein]-cysteine S-methyltransferase
MTGLAWASLSTPVGRLSVGCSSSGVAQVHFGRPDDPARGEPAGPRRRPGDRPGDRSAELAAESAERPGERLEERDGQRDVRCLTDARRQLAEYLRGQRRAFDLPLDWTAVAGLQRQVLGVLYECVGYGQTVTYGGLARQAGLPQEGQELPARAVGQIMGSNPIPVIVPCHRVVASDGLGGYSGGTGPEVKRWLLILEGALPPTLDWEPASPDS